MTTPLQATPTDNLGTATAGLYRAEINTGTIASPTWVEMKGITKWAPKFEQQTEDDTDISSGAWKSEFPVGNGFSVEVEGLTKGTTNPAFVADPGVQALLDRSKKIGNDGIGHFRYWRTDDIAEAQEFFATCGVSRNGEKPPALDKWGGNLTGRGKPIDIAKPLVGPASFTVDFGGATALGATFVFGGETTASVLYDTTAPTFKAALVALDDSFKSSDWTVTGSAGVFTVTTPGGALTLGVDSTTGGTGVTVTPV